MIYLCRHGQTEFNREGRIQGQSESVLTDLGRRQAAAMGALLHRLIQAPSDWRLVASPLLRTRATADIIAARLGMPVELDRRLMEVGVGAWEGLLRSDLSRDHPAAFATPSWVFHGPGGETYAVMRERLAQWLAEQAEDSSRRLIVVSHGVAGRVLRGIYAGLSETQAMAQDIPQDAVFRLGGGRIERIDCDDLQSSTASAGEERHGAQRASQQV